MPADLDRKLREYMLSRFEYTLSRYRPGIGLLAEEVRVEAYTAEGAIDKARQMYSRMRSCARDKYKIVKIDRRGM